MPGKLALALALLASLPLSARAGETITATIPMGFTAGDKQYPSGEYSLELKVDAGQVALRSRKGGPVILRASNLTGGDVYADAERFEIVLSKYDGEVYLSQVWIKNRGMEVAKSSGEKAREDGGATPRLLKLKVKPR